MAIAYDLADEAIQNEASALEQKRQKTGNPDYDVNDQDGHGSGLIPEEIWKEKYSPNSNPETGVGEVITTSNPPLILDLPQIGGEERD